MVYSKQMLPLTILNDIFFVFLIFYKKVLIDQYNQINLQLEFLSEQMDLTVIDECIPENEILKRFEYVN